MFSRFSETTTKMTIVAALHLTVESGDQPNIQLKSNGMVHISIPLSDNQRKSSNATLSIDGLCIVLSKVQGNWKIEGKLTVSLPAIFDKMHYYTGESIENLPLFGKRIILKLLRNFPILTHQLGST
jgi:hypothetical protein